MDPAESAPESLGLNLAAMAAPAGDYVPYARRGDLLFLAGAVSTRKAVRCFPAPFSVRGEELAKNP
jgi:hypothetical protein